MSTLSSRASWRRWGCTWKATLRIEVEDDFDPVDNLSQWPEEALDQITSETAELTDWQVRY